MAKSLPIELPLGPIPDLLTWWRKSKVKALIIGGLAVAIHSRARSTKDVDAVVMLGSRNWTEFLEEGAEFSFRTRVPDPITYAEQNRVFVLRHEKSGIDVDLSIGGLPFEIEAFRRSAGENKPAYDSNCDRRGSHHHESRRESPTGSVGHRPAYGRRRKSRL